MYVFVRLYKQTTKQLFGPVWSSFVPAFPFLFLLNACFVNICSREYTMQSEMFLGTVSSSGLVTINATVEGVPAVCTASGPFGSILGTCVVPGQGSCDFKLSCVDGICLNGAPVPPMGANGFPAISGSWSTVGGTCASDPQFSTSFELTQCGSTLLVVPSAATQVRGGCARAFGATSCMKWRLCVNYPLTCISR